MAVDHFIKLGDVVLAIFARYQAGNDGYQAAILNLIRVEILQSASFPDMSHCVLW